MKAQLLGTTCAAAMLMLSPLASAKTLVSTIVGSYDNGCADATCGGVSGITNFASNGGGSGDTPNLFIYNPTSFAFTGVTLTLTGYNGNNAGVVETLGLPDIAANTLYKLNWGNGGVTDSGPSSGTHSLFQNDYDDQYGGQISAPFTDSAGNSCGSGSGTVTSLCAFVGDFDVKFKATWDGGAIAADFSPDNTQGGGNAAGTFVGWEGLDQVGMSETKYDYHSTSFPGTLANIYTGTTGIQSVPEPASMALFGAGLGALGLTRRRRKSA